MPGLPEHIEESAKDRLEDTPEDAETIVQNAPEDGEMIAEDVAEEGRVRSRAASAGRISRRRPERRGHRIGCVMVMFATPPRQD